jgi:hypothetical protein
MGNDKETSPEAAKTSSEVLRGGQYSDKAKTSAGSALSQAEGNEDNQGEKGGSESKGGKKD